MKKFWLVLLSAGLIMAFSVSAFAVDVQVSGTYYAAGMYLDQTSLMKGSIDKSVNPYTGMASGLHNNDDVSTAFYFQRLRVRTDFTISPGLKFITRFDAMERIWGGARSAPGTTTDLQSAGTKRRMKISPLIGPTLSIHHPLVCSRSAMRRITYGEPFSEVAAAELPPGKFYTGRRSERLLSAHLFQGN